VDAAQRGDPMEAVLAAGGECGRLMRRVDWNATPLGPMTRWPQSLRSAVSICLLSRFPICLWWGPELVLLYNDDYRPMLGNKDPLAMGRPGQLVWAEIWPTIGPMLNGVMETGKATWSDDQLLLIERSGYAEECYFTFSYSPISDEKAGVGGIFCAVNETTRRVVGERRLRTLGEVASGTISATSAEEACVRTADVLARNQADVPFSLIYLVDGQSTTPECVASTGDVSGVQDMHWPLASVIEAGSVQKVDLGRAADVPGSAVVLPIPQAGSATATGALVVGVSPRRALDDDYLRFFELTARQLGTAVADARVYQMERKRAEALAELDRAKTVFFSNVSHEFRTPLTLMLGPLEQAMLSLPADERIDVEVAHRNALRLLKLVNTLLDFSRIESGRIEAAFEPVDLAALTTDLASAFRSAVEAGGLRLVVDCPPLAEPAYVDREMWEKIVLNLVSNAFKFTLDGEIAVRTRMTDGGFQLTVSDTGAGVPPDELPRLWERFYRARGGRSRSHEGTGIGLSLVRELVAMHGGKVAVESEVGAGTTFTVTIPRGSAHVPQDRLAPGRTLPSTAVGAAPFVEEARRWLPDAPAALDGAAAGPDRMAFTGEADAGPTAGARVLVADDNADMRSYLEGLLSPHWRVESVADGAMALERALASPPDLVLSDVMMPGLDGFGLLRALRADERTRHVPVVMLSARAGDEATVEGLEAGADDYVVKPFVARELVARVRANLELSAMRLSTRQAMERYDAAQSALQRATVSIAAVAKHIRAGVELPALLARLSETAAMLVGARRAVFWSLDGSELRAENEDFRVRVDPDGSDLAESVVFSADVLDTLRATAGICVPWQSGDRPLGLLAVYDSNKPDGFSDDDRWVLRIAALAAALVWEHKNAEDALAVINQREAGRLRAALDRSAELEKTKAEFLRLASHELRAPLTVLGGYVSLIGKGVLGELPADMKTVLPVLDRKVKEMRVLVEQMLETARLEDNSLALQKGRIDLRDVIANAVETMSPLVPDTHRLTVLVPDEPLPVDGDASRLTTVLTNLIDNAIRYSPGGGRVDVRAAIRPRSRRVFVQVSDEGLGIAARDLPRLFTRFGRIVTRENSHISGTGLGLYLSNELVHIHGGRITVRSTPQKGTSFTVVLPVAGAEVVPIPVRRRRQADTEAPEPAPIASIDFRAEETQPAS